MVIKGVDHNECRYFLTTVRCRYNAVNFHQNHHKTRPIAHPLGRDMGCILWVQTYIHILPQSPQLCVQYHVILDGVITAFDCSLYIILAICTAYNICNMLWYALFIGNLGKEIISIWLHYILIFFHCLLLLLWLTNLQEYGIYFRCIYVRVRWSLIYNWQFRYPYSCSYLCW